MTSLSSLTLPDHTQLPCEDGTFVNNWQEHPQSILLTDSITPVLQKLHPDGDYCIGQDMGIYWTLTDPPQEGAKAPDWFYVPNVPSELDGQTRRSYVLWKEHVAPLIAIEFVSDTGKKERDKTSPFGEYEPDAEIDEESDSEQVRDKTPPSKGKPGKFWVYEQAIRIPYYAIYEVRKASVEVYRLVGNTYRLMLPNERGHYPIEGMEVELGIWRGLYQTVTLPWLRWWDNDGNLLLTGAERAEIEKQRANAERQRANAESQRANAERQKREQLVEKLSSLSPEQLAALGIDPQLLE